VPTLASPAGVPPPACHLGYLGDHDLLRVRTDAEKYLLMAALNLVECVAFAGSTTAP